MCHNKIIMVSKIEVILQILSLNELLQVCYLTNFGKILYSFSNTKMTLTVFLKQYSLGFFFFGIYSRNDRLVSKRFCSRILSNIPKIVNLTIVLLYVYLFCAVLLKRTTTLFNHLLLLTSCVPNLISIFWIKIDANGIEHIIQSSDEIEYHLKTLLGVKKQHLKKLKRTFSVKLSVLLSTGAIYFIKIFLKTKVYFLSIDIVISLMILYKVWAVFFVLIFIDYNGCLLFVLNEYLEQLQSNPNFKLFKIDRFVMYLHRHIQTVYFEIYQSVLIINSVFGLFLLAFFLDQFTILISSMYYLFLGLADLNLVPSATRN